MSNTNRDGTPKLKGNDHWVTCTRYDGEPASHHRHIVKRGHVTTVCGATASTPTIWRADKRKKPCPKCIEKYGKAEAR